jgi:hypothetical protein
MSKDGDHGHDSVRMLVWAEIDVGIVGAVRYLMNLPGVMTHTSCQGSDAATYRPYVMVTWKDDAARALIVEYFDLSEEGDHWAYAHPKTPIKKLPASCMCAEVRLGEQKSCPVHRLPRR